MKHSKFQPASAMNYYATQGTKKNKSYYPEKEVY